ncbi:asparagine--tRNA ligase [Buchnera aphidicola]|uniref:asparagine--tRNA ligase n=1 Tax=Buchnera aphidicola TaxID=9 RepID=UPI0022382709|nr:asparagine--tRNA ligase [Buchnera aphidicola]MCW5197784.1 asparagine--tRNA ligase [Buchnera aphidicola (Chaitophorus viminalis)]
MKIVSIKDIFKKKVLINSIIQIQGWIKNKRNSKSNLLFIDIYDGSCVNTLQVIVNKNLLIDDEDNEIIKSTPGCSVSVQGKLIYSLNVEQKFEMHVNKIKVVGWIQNPDSYPMSSKKHSMEHLRNFAHLRPRTNIIGCISRIRSSVFYSIHKFFYKNNYYWVSSPIITSLNAEGAGDMFSVQYSKNNDKKKKFYKNFFGKEVFLTVSGQLSIEAYACALSKVYTLGPIFRAENSNTSRHLSEFWMLEAELAFSNLKNIIEVVQKMLKYIISFILKNNTNDLLFFEKNFNDNIIDKLENFLENKIKKINYKDAIKILQDNKIIKTDSSYLDIELNLEHEKFLVDKYFKKTVIIQNYPKNFKPFYMRINNDKKTVSAFDVLFPQIGEIIGGSQREERILYLDKRIHELNLNINDYQWYRELRFYGTVPHAGFGLGLERLIMYITGIKNIKDVIPFPRTPKNANF